MMERFYPRRIFIACLLLFLVTPHATRTTASAGAAFLSDTTSRGTSSSRNRRRCIHGSTMRGLSSSIHRRHLIIRPTTPTTTHLRMKEEEKDEDNDDEDNLLVDQAGNDIDSQLQNNSNNYLSTTSSLTDRFINPKIDDPAMPLTEVGLAQIVAPSLQLFWLSALSSPYPSWAQPIFSNNLLSAAAGRGSFLAPTLIHGAGLASCWLAGCLAARGYELSSDSNTNSNDSRISAQNVLLTTLKAGAFASGLLILATQFDLYTEFGRYVQVGDSPETDRRIYLAIVEVINDIFFEAITLITWRLYYYYNTA